MYKFLYDEIAKRWYRGNGNSIWVFSDPHFSDIESYKLRFPNAFPIPEGMSEEECKQNHEFRVKMFDNEQIKNINSKVGKNDTIIFLGDIGNVECIKKIRGYKVLIMGNHDKGASNYKRNSFVKTFYEHNYKTFDDMLEEAKSYGVLESLTYADWLNTSPEDDTYLAYYDNHLFDEVYEGPLMINDRVILSHEPIFPTVQFLYNIHGHVHNKNYVGDEHHMNVCAEVINYYPINLGSLIKHGLLKDIDSIHRMTIDGAIKRKSKK